MSTSAPPLEPSPPPLNSGANDREWRIAITSVLAGEGLRLAAQPIVDVQRVQVVGYELLARFNGPRAATPDVWFAWAETLGLGAELDARVVRQALTMRNDLPPDTFVTINIDPLHLEDEKLLAEFTNVGTLDGVVIELTEHSAIDDYGAIVRRLAPLREIGAKVAIDDAGSGYAGLQWLMALSPDLIKLDRALIDHIDEDEVKTALVEMLGTFADRIDAWVLAEGIERTAELDVVHRLGIPLAQGYLLARPSLELWPCIEPSVLSHLKPRSKVDVNGATVAPLIETVATRLITSSPLEGTSVVVDDRGQPLLLDLPSMRNAKVLAVRPDETIRSALERALTRTPANRWQPIVCVSEARQTLGIIRLERLVHKLVRDFDERTPILEETQ